MTSWLQKKAPFGESILARFRTSLPVKDEVDIAVYLENFQAHWQQAWVMMQSHQDGAIVTMDEVNTVLNHTDQLRVLLCWELEQRQEQQQGAETPPPGRLADLFLSCRVPERLLVWSACCGPFEPLLKSELLRVFEQLLRAGGGGLLEQQALLRPLTDLLLRCRSAPSSELHRRLVQVLSQLCRALHARPSLLDLFLGLEPDGSASSFVIFSLLVGFVHGDGVVGGTAREALLFCTRLSAASRPLAEFIVQHSDFCEVLATGLSGLYSALPRTPPSDDEELPEVDAFASSLQFCNSVLQTCHPMIAAVLLELVYQGFLVSVMGPALHQSSVEAVVTATTYLELCVRSVDHPGLVRALLRLLLRHKHDDVTIIDTLVQRIAATPRLAVATLSLLQTLLNLNCEDVLLELVLRPLLPCAHLMASQRGRITETDLYGAGARRLLSLVPACCQPAAAADPLAAAAAWLQCGREARLALVACRRATRRWTYRYDGADPSPAEADRMARRRRGSGTVSLALGAEERGEADGETRREAVGRGGVTAGSPVVDGWRLRRLQGAEGRAGDPPTGTPPGEPQPAPGDGGQASGADQASAGEEGSGADQALNEHQASDGDQALDGDQASDGDQTSNKDGSGAESVPSRPPSPADGDSSVSSPLWATLSGVARPPSPPAAGADPELALSVGDVWATPPASVDGRGRDGEPDPDGVSLRLGILSLLPDEPSSAVLEPSSEVLEPSSEDAETARSAAEPSVVGAERAAVSGPGSPEKPSGPARVTPAGAVDLLDTGTAGPPLEGRERPAEVGDLASAVVEEVPVSAEVCEEPISIEVGEEAIAAENGEPSQAENGGPSQAQAGESSRAEVGEPSQAEVRESSPAEVGEVPVPPSSDLSTFVERHSGTVRAPPPPPPPLSVPAPSVPRPLLLSLQNSASDSSTAVPSIGPFLVALLERLDLATTNSLQLNLLLMSVISRLSHYPQPLLRSLLLNPTLVFQPSVRSLIQTLGSLKHRIDLATRSVQDSAGLVRWARRRLEARPAAAAPAAASPGLSPAVAGPGSGPASLPTQLGPPTAASADGDSGGFSLSGLAGRLRRALPAVNITAEASDQPRRQIPDTARTSVGAEQAEWDASERRVALTAVLLEQWLAELAAVALEHSVITDSLVFAV